MSSVFSEQILADKLSKLNNTQQCIETLSHWCIFNRSKAELVVATWDKQFHSSQLSQKVPLLYLANDILQNSKRKGNEFVNEFWKVLPAALKEVVQKGDDRGRSVVSRLVTIWEERRVFGSCKQSLKDVMLGEELPPPLELNKKRSRSVRIIKRDSRSIRTKLTIGGAAEKIVSAFHLVLTEQPNEDSEMNNCKDAVQRVRKMEKDVEVACNAKDPNRRTMANVLEEEEKVMKQCIEKLKLVEANRVALVARLREVLHEQESGLEIVRTQMQVAQAQVEEAAFMRRRLMDENCAAISRSSEPLPAENGTYAPKKTAAAIAAEVADKLTASSSSRLIMTSVLSTFAAEEAKNAALYSNSVNNLTPKPTQPLPALPSHSYQPVVVSTQSMAYHMLPIPSQQQYAQPAGVVMSPYAYGSMPPPPPLPQTGSPMVPLNRQMGQHQQQHGQPPQLPLWPPRPPSMAYYGNPHS